MFLRRYNYTSKTTQSEVHKLVPFRIESIHHIEITSFRNCLITNMSVGKSCVRVAIIRRTGQKSRHRRQITVPRLTDTVCSDAWSVFPYIPSSPLSQPVHGTATYRVSTFQQQSSCIFCRFNN